MKTKEDILKYKPAVFAAGVGRCIRISDAEAAMDEWLTENKPKFQMVKKTALQCVNEVEPNGELLTTDMAVAACEMYAEQCKPEFPSITEMRKAAKEYTEEEWKNGLGDYKTKDYCYKDFIAGVNWLKSKLT